MDTVQFNGKTNHDVGLICQDAGRRQRAEEQVIIHDIPFRNDQVLVHTDKYKPYYRPMRFAWKDKERTDQAMDWLRGVGKLTVSRDEGGYFKAHVVGGLFVAKESPKFDSFTVNFLINPGFFYLDSGDQLTVLTAPAVLYNPGTIYSQPLIKIVGSGSITLDINGKIVTLTGITDSITLDSETENAYRDNLLQGEKMNGEFPVLEPGNNSITWTGSVTRVEVTGRWRER